MRKEGRCEELAALSFQMHCDVGVVRVKHTMKQRVYSKINEACERKTNQDKGPSFDSETMHHH